MLTDPADPRAGKVSASRFEVLALCAGSEPLRESLPPEALETGDEYTELGDKLHKAWETGNTFPLNPEELEIYNNGIKTLDRILADWRQDFGIVPEDTAEGERESRFYLNDPATMAVIASGQLDRHYIATSKTATARVLICDFKGLWSPNLTPAQRNWQGRLQAVLARKEYGAVHVRMAFNKAMFGKQDVTDYDERALEFAEQSIFRAIWESKQPGAQRRPGRHCTYCPGKGYCPEAAVYSELPSVKREPQDELEETLKRVALMPVEDAITVWRKWGVAEKIFNAIEARLKSLPAPELARLGLKLKEGRRADKIEDKVGAFNVLRLSGFSSVQILGALIFPKGEIVKLRQMSAACSEKEADDWYEASFDAFIKRDRAKPSLVEV